MLSITVRVNMSYSNCGGHTDVVDIIIILLKI